MKRVILLSMQFFLFFSFCDGQSVINLTFTAIDSTTHVQLDSIKVMNQTRGCDTVLYYPDTSLFLGYVGIDEIKDVRDAFKVFQNYPNPVTYQTTISMYVPGKDVVSLVISDLLGRTIINTERVLDQGYHSFRFIPGSGNLFFFTAQWRGYSHSIKILHTSQDANQIGSLVYEGFELWTQQPKLTEDISIFTYTPGDMLLLIGYAGSTESGILDMPDTSNTLTFQFASNIPCPEMPTVTYGGHVYNTVQVFSQCWLKENLNMGTMIQGLEEMTDNDTIEKYCYNDEPDSCTKYGGLYQWDEMMQYTTQPGTQGICPPGWHLPTDEEWKVLEGAVDSQYGIGDPEWDLPYEYRGYDAGTSLKTTSGWNVNGNGTDLFGFSGVPGGFRYYLGYFKYVGDYGYWWTSTGNGIDSAFSRYLYYLYPEVYRANYFKESGDGVRCLRDN